MQNQELHACEGGVTKVWVFLFFPRLLKRLKQGTEVAC